MLERFQPILKFVCLALTLLVLYQIAGVAARKDPLRDFDLPEKVMAVAPSKLDGAPTNALSTSSAKLDANLPAAIQARVERITQSEILGPVIRPLPMALLGIAGHDAFLRAPNGQTGLLKEGGELGGIKLLRIGTNRVLIEHEGQTKELMLFSGFGSDPLLKSNSPK